MKEDQTRERRAFFFRAQGLTVGYHGRPLIREMEFALEKGKILTLIGPNGAGKSTVLKTIVRQLEPLGGTVFLEGKDLTEVSQSGLSRIMAVVLTERLRGEWMTCEDVVATGRYPYTGRFGIFSEQDYRIVEEAMELVHALDIRDQSFCRISDGQRQRVMLARAICQEPELLILDEPTSYLDVRYKLEFLSILQRLCREKGLTVILSLHELELAAKVSDRLLCLKGERVYGYGTPEKIFCPGYIAKLFGIETGNFDEENGGMELEAPRGKPRVFVIGGGGRASAVYRYLQREGIPFAAGILPRNDVDYPAARALAAEVLATEPYEPVPEELLRDAERRMETCERVISCREHFGSLDRANAGLAAYAQEKKLPLEYRAKPADGEEQWRRSS